MTLKLGQAQVPMIVTNHTYDVIGSYVPAKEMGGGTGLKYAASTIIYLTKSKERDSKKDWWVTSSNVRQRSLDLTRRAAKLQHVYFLTSEVLTNTTELLELGIEYGVFGKNGNRVLIGQSSVYPSAVLADPEKYFTPEVMEKLEEAAKKNFPMAIERIEETILRNLLHNEEYYRKVVPFLKAEYYEDFHEKVIYEEIADFASKYDKVPTKEVLTINLQNRNDLTDDAYQNSVSTVRELSDEWVDYEWLLDATEKWCKDESNLPCPHAVDQDRRRRR